MIVTIGGSNTAEEAVTKAIANPKPGFLPEFSPAPGETLEDLSADVELLQARRLIADLRSHQENPEIAALKYLELLDYREKLQAYHDEVKALALKGGESTPFRVGMVRDRCARILYELDRALETYRDSVIAKDIDSVTDNVRLRAGEILKQDWKLAEFIKNGFPDEISPDELRKIIDAMDPESRAHFADLCGRKAEKLYRARDKGLDARLATLGEHTKFVNTNANGNLTEEYLHLRYALYVHPATKNHQGLRLHRLLQTIKIFRSTGNTVNEHGKLMKEVGKLHKLKTDIEEFQAKPVPHRGFFLNRECRIWDAEFIALQARYMHETSLGQIIYLGQDGYANPLAANTKLDSMVRAIDKSLEVLSRAMTAHDMVEDLAQSGHLGIVAQREIYTELAIMLTDGAPLELKDEWEQTPEPAAAANPAAEQ